MQDELNATLALCDTDPDCPHYGCCHVECLPAARRPQLIVEVEVRRNTVLVLCFLLFSMSMALSVFHYGC